MDRLMLQVAPTELEEGANQVYYRQTVPMGLYYNAY